MRTERVLVVGATGMLGAPVAQQLLADGWRVRCLVRDPERAQAQLGNQYEYVQADVTRVETLDVAMEDCDYMHLNLRGTNTLESYESQEVQGSAHCARAAKRHGVRRITYLSGAGRINEATERFFPVRIKSAVEACLAESGVGSTVFRATHFMESLAAFVREGRATILGSQPHALHYVAARDYARMVCRALDCDAALGRTLYIFGPQAYTMREALERYLAALHPNLQVQSLPLPIARCIATLTRNRDLRFAVELFAAFSAIGEAGDPTEANHLLGVPRTTLDQWLAAREKSPQASA